MLSRANGSGGDRHFFDSHRALVLSAVLSLAGLATGTATAFALLQSFVLSEALLLGCSVVLAFGVAAAQTRHLPLAALAALAPVPGLLWAAPLSGGSAFGAVPFLAYGFGYAVAALAADGGLQRLLQGQGDMSAPAAAYASLLMALLAALWFWGSAAALQAAADILLAAASALLLMPMGFWLLHFDEALMARANRVRETQLRFAERLSLVTQPRWGLSFAGIAIVFLTLGWFGAVQPHGLWPLLLRGVTVLLLATAAGSALGGWREGLATALIAVTVCLLLRWAAPGEPGIGVLMTGTIALLPLLQGGRRALHFRQSGDTPPLARQRSLEESPGAFFALAGALAAILPLLFWRPGSAMFAAGIVLAAGGIVFAPAAVTALEAIVPRRRRAKDIFGRNLP
jgi:hypothetical protein